MKRSIDVADVTCEVHLETQVLEVSAAGEEGEGVGGELGAGCADLDIQGYRANGVFVEGIDDAEVIEHQIGAAETEGFVLIEETATDEVHVDLAGDMVEFGGFQKLVRP